MLTRLLRTLLLISLLSLALTHAYGEFRTWVGPTTDSKWSTATNWSPNGVPGTSDPVLIYRATGDYVDLDSGNAGAFQMMLGGSSTTSYSMLVGNGSANLSISGWLIINQSGIVRLQAGDVIWQNDPFIFLSNYGQIYVAKGATFNAPNYQRADTVFAGSSFDIEGSFSPDYFVLLDTIEKGVGSVGPGRLNLSNGQVWNIFPLGYTLNNRGVLTVGMGTTLNLSGQLNNSDALSQFVVQGAGTVATLDGFWNDALINNGSVLVGTNATLSLLSQPNGITSVVAGSTFDIAGDFNTVTTNGTFNGFYQLSNVMGTVILEDGKVWDVYPGGYPNTTGNITVDAGYLEAKSGTTLTIHGNATVKKNSGISINDPLPTTVNITGTLTNLGGFINVVGPDAVLNAGSIVNGGMLSLPGGSTVNVANGFYQLDAGTLGEAIGASGFGILLAADGEMMLAGALDVMLEPGFNPAIGTTYQFILFQPGELSGMFASIQNRYFNGGTEQWLVSYNNAGGYVELQAAPAPEPSGFLLLGTGLLSIAYGIRRRVGSPR